MGTRSLEQVFASRYLVYPELFPNRMSGEPWGDDEVTLVIASSRHRLRGLSRRQRHELVERWPAFVVRDVDTDGMRVFSSRVFRAASSDFRTLDLRGLHYQLDFDYREDGLGLAGTDLMARLDLGSDGGGALWTPHPEGEAFVGSLENYLRVAVAYQCLEAGGAMLHSASVIDEGKALLLLGHSGAGKSTVARLGLESGRAILSDDLNPVVRSEGRSPLVIGAPFQGDAEGRGANETFPLAGFSRLEKGTMNALRTMGPGETVASLTACSPFVNHDPFRSDRLFTNLTGLALGTNASVLTFRRDGGFWNLLESVASERSSN